MVACQNSDEDTLPCTNSTGRAAGSAAATESTFTLSRLVGTRCAVMPGSNVCIVTIYSRLSREQVPRLPEHRGCGLRIQHGPGDRGPLAGPAGRYQARPRDLDYLGRNSGRQNSMNKNNTTRTTSRPTIRSAPAAFLLHGHHVEGNLARAATAEAVGTFVLVLAITSAAVAATLAPPAAGAPYGSLAVPVAAGLALAILAASLGHISGAHLNPAVTLGLAASSRFPWAYAVTYIAAQFVGAIAAAAVTWGLHGQRAKT